MLIAAQGLLALIPVLVVLAVFFPHLTGNAVDSFTDATGLGASGNDGIRGEVTNDQVRSQTGVIGLLITLVSATSFARAVQRMYERVWEVPHIGGVSGARRCFTWLIGWLMTLQIVGGLGAMLGAIDGLIGVSTRLVAQILFLSLLWWGTSWVLLFGRVRWHKLALGALLTGSIGVLYNRASGLVMPPYVSANADQFGTLGIILAVSTWLIGFAAIMVGSALVGRVVSEDPTVLKLVGLARESLAASWARLRRRPAGETAAR